MKKIFLSVTPIVMCVVLFFACGNPSRNSHQYVLHTTSETIKLSINEMEEMVEFPFYKERSDTFPLNLMADTLYISLYSEIDSIHVALAKNEAATFSIDLPDYLPMILQIKNGIEVERISFDRKADEPFYPIVYDTDPNTPYLKTLREKYELDKLIASASSDLEKVRLVSAWVHGLWEHDGDNVPENPDALSILEEVITGGKRFRCVEYGTVTAACLKSLGFPARVVGLKLKEIETIHSGGGHVVMEVFLPSMDKWVMVDSQFDATVCCNEVPLNAVELQKAISDGETLQLLTSDEEVSLEVYIPWIYPYLYYFDTSLDHRERISGSDRVRIDDKSALMLVPEGAIEPKVMQQVLKLDHYLYINSLSTFYQSPEIK